MRAFCGLSVSDATMSMASNSVVGVTRPLPTRLDRTSAGRAAAGIACISLTALLSKIDSVPLPVPAKMMPFAPPLIAA